MRSSGNDRNSGAEPVSALRQITTAGKLARDGYTIVVGPGTYDGDVTLATVGESPNGVLFVADPTGGQTGDAPGPVIVKATGTAGFTLSSSPGSLIDGFTINGGADGGIVIKSGKGGGSDNLTIQDCVIFGNTGDGIRIQDSANVTVFNNLVFQNRGNGIVIAGQGAGSKNASVTNNTVVSNGIRGLVVGNTSAASPGAFVHNNIFQANGGDVNLKVYSPPPNTVPRSDVNYDGDFNLVSPGTYQPAGIDNNHDLIVDARFASGACPASVLPAVCVYHLQANSPAINKGDSSITVDQQKRLRGLTTTGGTMCDQAALDIGFHYPRTGPCTSVQ